MVTRGACMVTRGGGVVAVQAYYGYKDNSACM
jgi:hypothetical protein